MSCATCHQQDKAFTDGKKFSKGITGQEANRSAMSLANVAYLPVLTWANPLLTSLEVQALIPLFGEHPVEMGMAGKEAVLFERLKADPTYRTLFRHAFPAEAKTGDDALYSLSTVTKALASFQRTLISVSSPYDRYRYGGELSAIGPAAKRGEALFLARRWSVITATEGSTLPTTFSIAVCHFQSSVFTILASTTPMERVDTLRGTWALRSSLGLERIWASSERQRFET